MTGTGTVRVWLVCVLSGLIPFPSNVENQGFFVFCSLLITKQSQWKSCDMEPSSLWVERGPSLSLRQLLELGCWGCVRALDSTTSLSLYPFASSFASDIWRKVLWMALQAEVSCAFTQILSLLEEEGDEPLWRTWTTDWGQLLSSAAELQILQQVCNAQKGRWKLKKRDNPLNTSFALFIGLFQPN